jgi:integrase
MKATFRVAQRVHTGKTRVNCSRTSKLAGVNLAEARKQGLAIMKKAFAAGTTERRARIKAELASMGHDPIALVGAWSKMHKPSTLNTYTAVLRGIVPEAQKATLKVALRATKKLAPMSSVKRALPMTLEQMKIMVRKGPSLEALTAIIMWGTASRHADLAAMTVTEFSNGTPETTLRFELGNHKSDIFGQRNVTKWISAPARIAAQIKRIIANKSFGTYVQMYHWAKTFDKALTVHSFRRGAATFLASNGFNMEQVIILTGHTPTADPMLAGRRYVDSHPSQPEANLSLRMTAALLDPLWAKLI